MKRRSKLFAAILSVYMVITMLPTVAFAVERETAQQTEVLAAETSIKPEGKGSSAEPYLITSVENLEWLRQEVANGNNFGAHPDAGNTKVYFSQTADIDYQGATVTPIGSHSAGKRFNGIYDGNNHIIKNVKIEASQQGVGFFGKTFTATIKNVHLENASVWSSGNAYVGGIVGHGYATIDNCSFEGSVGDGYQVGGIAGSGGFTITNCKFDGEISGADWGIGGIVGNRQDGGKIENCYVSGTITAKGNTYNAVGGIVGIENYTTIPVKNNYVNADVTLNGNTVDTPILGSYNEVDNVSTDAYENNSWNREKIDTDKNIVHNGTKGTPEGVEMLRDNNLVMLESDLQYIDADDPNQVTIMASSTVTPDAVKEAMKTATIGDTTYYTLESAIDAAKNGGTVELLNDVEVETWNQVWDTKDLTIKGNKHTVTIDKVKFGQNGDYLFYGAKNLNVSDLTVNFKTNGNGFDMHSGKLENVTMNGGENSNYAVFVSASTDETDKVEINNCAFNDFKGSAIYSQPGADGTVTADIAVTNSEIKNCGIAMVSYAAKTTFTGNTVTGGSEISFAAKADSGNADKDVTYTVTGNTFDDAGKIWFYGADLEKVEFEKNKVLGSTSVSTEDAKSDTQLDVSGNYWGGDEPTAEQLKGDNTKSDNYYKKPAMKPTDLNTYVPPSGGVVTPPADDTCKKDDTCPISKFTDADPKAWYHDGVHYCIETGLMAGIGNAKFQPNGVLTRAQLAQILYNKAGKPAVSQPSTFTDVPATQWYANAIAWAQQNNVVSGIGGNKFAPEEKITREQIAAMLYRNAGSKPVTGTLNFKDAANVSDWAKDAMLWATQNKVINGALQSDGTLLLNAKLGATRAETATMLENYYNK